MLIIGAPKSGKTTFQAQLYGRLQAHSGRIKLVKNSEDFSGLEKAYERLADGEETSTTPADENLEVTLRASLDEEEFDLVFKDYGGEQVRNIIDFLEYDNRWAKRAKLNDRWILFIRPNRLFHHYDLSLTGYAEKDESKDNSKNDPNPKDRLSDQYRYIELIQTLLHARETSIKSPIQSPKLLIVLTCWDELHSDQKPLKELQVRMPFFYHFLDSLWQKDSYKVIGLSAQHFPLDNEEAKNRYLDELPESFGYLVLEDDPEEPDLTRLVEIALKL